jgi:hypothetical protein
LNFARRRLVALGAVLAGSAAVSSCGNSHGNPQAPGTPPESGKTRVPGEYLVTLAAAGESNAIANTYGQFGIKAVKDLGNNVFLVSLRDDPGPATMESLGAGNPRIKAVQPNYVYRTRGSESIR